MRTPKRNTLKRTAQAQSDAAILKGTGEARATELTLTAKAKGDAAAEYETLAARAQGTKQLNDALAHMSDAAKLILILDRMPSLLDKVGEAGEKVLGSMFAPIAAGLGSIDSIRIVDMGGNGAGVNKMSGVVTDTVFKVLGELKAKGIDLKGMLGGFGINTDGLETLFDGVGPSAETDKTAGSEPPALTS